MRRTTRRLLRWYFLLPIALVATGLAIPVTYLVVRGIGAETDRVADLVLTTRNVRLLVNTLTLAVGVLVVSTCLSFPLAWLTSRSDLARKRMVTIIGVLPLAIPGYVLAYVILGTTGAYGWLARSSGVDVPVLTGYWGSLLALSVYTSPYLFLNLRAAMLGIDPSLEEAARSLGLSAREVLFRVTIPQLRPAVLAGGLLVVLHVMGDFGVVSLMRYETFSYAIYLQFAAAYERTYAALLALMLLLLTGLVLIGEARLLRNLSLTRVGSGSARESGRVKLGRWTPLAVAYCVAFALLSAGVPVATIVAWSVDAPRFVITSLLEPLWNAVMASAPAALAATVLAVPLAYMSVRLPSRVTFAAERLSYIGYAMPPLALALAYIFFALSAVPALYQTLGLLIAAYTLHFLAEAIGPVRSGLYQAPPQLEEAARSLGRTPLRAFVSSTLPLLRSGIVVSLSFVFLSALKELPLTILLSPPGFETLSVNVWSYTNEAMFGTAAPYALALTILSAIFVGLLLGQETASHTTAYLPHE